MKRVIPCLDIDRGAVVKGVNFVNLRRLGDPVELAARYEDDGADELLFLDINATAEGRGTVLDLVTRVAGTLSIPFTVGGGLRAVDDVAAFLDAGADKVALNSSAVATPDLIDAASRAYGAQCIVVAVDSKRDPDGTARVYTHGGRRRTERSVEAWAREVADRGAGEVLLTTIDRDGTGDGFEVDLTGRIARALPIQVIASGGAQHPDHFVEAFRAGADAALAATMFHTGAFRIADVKHAMRRNDIPVRLLETTDRSSR